jgi:hypothetical protein
MDALTQARALAAAVAAALQAELVDLAAQITVAWTLPRELSELTEPLISITPTEWESRRTARAVDSYELTLEIGFIQALAAGAADLQAELEAFLDTVASVVACWQYDDDGEPGALRAVAHLAECEFVRIAQPTVLDPEALANRVAASIVTVTYTAQGAKD